jgi:asparagine synthase (glutamine-hydrolysing)
VCGLVALYRRGGEPVHQGEVVAMRDLLAHRGPDGAGLLIDGSVGLGFRRLRVIDLAGGHQPMPSPGGQAHIVFNGEIYNYRSLRRLLASRGVTLRTESDTETILGLYELFGLRCVEYLHGMFAFVIWDRGRRRLVAARDRMGIKPLYLLRRGQTIALASEIKAFLPLAEWTPRLDEERLPEYLIYRGLAGGASLFAGVEQLAPGELLVATPEGLRREIYWRLPRPHVPGVTPAPAGGERSDLRWAEELDALLQEVVSDHLVSDVPLGTFNSGGVDSSLTTALAARARSEPLHTYSVGFAEAAFDESRYAEAVAERFGTHHHQLTVPGEEYAAWLRRAIWHHDEPLSHPHCVHLLRLSQLAKERVTVVLTGEGADELFGGYRRYRLPALVDRLPVPAAWLRWALALGGRCALGDLERLRAEALLAAVPARLGGGDSRLLVEGLAAFVSRRAACRLLALPPDAAALARGGAAGAAGIGGVVARRPEVLAATLWFDQQTYLQTLLQRLDRMTMAAGLEGRVPLLDHRVVELAAMAPPAQKTRGRQTKILLKRVAARYLPPTVIARKKAGFSVPFGAWMRAGGPLADLLSLLVEPNSASRGPCEAGVLGRLVEEHRQGRRDHGDVLWGLVNFELWQRQWQEEARRAATATAVAPWSAAS